jgi:hypothetical protein
MNFQEAMIQGFRMPPGFVDSRFYLFAVSCFPPFLIEFAGRARVVKWQTRTFEGRMPKGMRVQVPPRALPQKHVYLGKTTFSISENCHKYP